MIGARLVWKDDETNNWFELDLGSVTSYSETFSKSVSRFPIASRSTEEAFAIESSNSMQISISFARRSPDEPKAYTTWRAESLEKLVTQSTMISNTDWIERAHQAMNRWQMRSDGFTLQSNVAIEGDGETLNGRPSRTLNGYVKSFSWQAKAGDVQFVYGSLTFVVGTMHCKTARKRQ